MKKILIMISICVVLWCSGCAFVASKDMVYGRMGDQQLDGVIVNRDPNGIVHFEMQGQKSEAKALLAAIKLGMNLTGE